ncbi:MAG: beta strand repeat-containing protein [Planctomycetota bacterium]
MPIPLAPSSRAASTSSPPFPGGVDVQASLVDIAGTFPFFVTPDINRAGRAEFTDLGLDTTGLGFVHIGVSGLGGHSDGSLSMLNGSINAIDLVRVGESINTTSTAVGALDITNGNLTTPDNFLIGLASSPDAPAAGASANGAVVISNGAASANALIVGRAFDATSATGALNVDRGLTLNDYISVGVTDNAPASNASGHVINASGPFSFNGKLDVGVAEAGVANGEFRHLGGGATPSASTVMRVGWADNNAIATGTFDALVPISDANLLLVGVSQDGDASGTFRSANLSMGLSSVQVAVGVMRGFDEIAFGDATGFAEIVGALTFNRSTPSPFLPNVLVGVLETTGAGFANGQADGTLIVRDGVSDVSTVLVGFANTDSDGAATGRLDVTGGGLHGVGLGGDVRIGQSTAANAPTEGRVSIAADLNNFEDLTVGQSTRGANATGSLTVTRGGIDLSGDLRVGVGDRGATVDGSVQAAGPLNASGLIQVGVAQADASTNATGTVQTGTGGLVNAPSGVFVGAANDGAANGSLLTSADFNITGSTLQVGFTQDGHATGAFSAGDVVFGAATSQSVRVGNIFQSSGPVMAEAAGTADILGRLEFNPSNATNLFPILLVGALEVLGAGSVDGSASGTLSVAQGISGVSSAFIGYAIGQTVGGANGNLTVQSGDFSGNGQGGDLWVGRWASGGSGVANGSLRVLDGSVYGFDLLRIGSAAGDNTAYGSAELHHGPANEAQNTIVGWAAHGAETEGTLTLTDAAFRTGSLGLGVVAGATASAQATGQIQAHNAFVEVNGPTNIALANANSGATAHAIAQLHLADSVMTAAGPLTVAHTSGDGAAIAEAILYLERSLIAIDDQLTLGDASTLNLLIEGVSPATYVPLPGDYSRILSSSSSLDGALTARFDFLPSIGDFFDVIVTNQFDGISGAFHTVDILGLPASLTMTHGVVLNDLNHEVYRLNIQAIPEPASLTLIIVFTSAALLRRRTRFTRPLDKLKTRRRRRRSRNLRLTRF